jgi:hypothetical protein
VSVELELVAAGYPNVLVIVVPAAVALAIVGAVAAWIKFKDK